MASDTTQDLELSEVWEALEQAGAAVYLLCEDGVSTGTRVIHLGQHHSILEDDTDGYAMHDRSDLDWAELVAEDGYDEDAAIRAASDLDGYFGVVGVPGSQYYDFEWFEAREEARAWMERIWAETMHANPVLGTIEGFTLTAAEAFEVTYRDGNRAYFWPKQVGPGFEPRFRGEAE
jgi:putative intracellular protease/amidase